MDDFVCNLKDDVRLFWRKVTVFFGGPKFKAGDTVVCIKSDGPGCPLLNMVLTVRDVGSRGDLWFEEHFGGWSPERFRLI